MTPFIRSLAILRMSPLVVCALAAQPLWAQENSSPPADGPGQRLLVLNDGGVLSGNITRDGERYVVETSGGGRMHVAASNVMLVCGSLSEAYQRRRQQLTRPSADGHLALAEWCLRNNLVVDAERELASAEALEPRHPRLALLARRLAVARQEPRQPAIAAPLTAKSPSPSVRPTELPGAKIGAVPDRVVERFTRKVQPVLVNNCTESGCHQPGGAESFQLDRALLHGLANRRSTMNNLAAVLALVDRAEPDESPLLTVPRRPHGQMENAVFGPRQEQTYKRLVEWVALVVQTSPAEPAIAPPAELLADAFARSAAGLAGDDLPSAEDEPDAVPDGASFDVAEDVMQASYEEAVPTIAPSMPPLRVGAQLERWEPRDPFDAEIFNRRYAQRTTAARPANAADDSAPRSD